MSGSIENFNKLDYSDDKGYVKLIKGHKEVKIEEAKKEVKKKYVSLSTYIFWIIVFTFFVYLTLTGNSGDGKEVFVVCVSTILIFIILLIRLPEKKRKALKNKLEEIEKEIKNYNSTILNHFLENRNDGEMKELGKAFLMNHNKITGTQKREYLGNIFLSFGKDKNIIYLNENEQVYEKEFKISDIISFKRISHEGLGDVKAEKNYARDIENVIDSDNRASERRADVSISRATGKGSFHNNIRADKANLEARRAREELDKEMKNENKRMKDETIIRLLEFKDGDYLLLSHLNEANLMKLEEKIENQ